MQEGPLHPAVWRAILRCAIRDAPHGPAPKRGGPHTVTSTTARGWLGLPILDGTPQDPNACSTQPAPSHHGPRPANAIFRPLSAPPESAKLGTPRPRWPQSTPFPSKAARPIPMWSRMLLSLFADSTRCHRCGRAAEKPTGPHQLGDGDFPRLPLDHRRRLRTTGTPPDPLSVPMSRAQGFVADHVHGGHPLEVVLPLHPTEFCRPTQRTNAIDHGGPRPTPSPPRRTLQAGLPTEAAMKTSPACQKPHGECGPAKQAGEGGNELPVLLDAAQANGQSSGNGLVLRSGEAGSAHRGEGSLHREPPPSRVEARSLPALDQAIPMTSSATGQATTSSFPSPERGRRKLHRHRGPWGIGHDAGPRNARPHDAQPPTDGESFQRGIPRQAHPTRSNRHGPFMPSGIDMDARRTTW